MGAMMGRKATELNALAVSRLTKPGLHFVGAVAGLALLVADTGAKSWILRKSIAGKRRDMGLGGYPDVTLAQAREKAREKRALVEMGIDPIEDRRSKLATLAASRAKVMTFDECVTAYIKAHGDGWKNPKHRQQWQNTLDTYASPFIGAIDVALVDTGLVLKCLEPIWKDKTETATRLRGRIENVLDWATTREYRQGENPARWRGHLDQLLVKPSKIQKVEHHAALPYVEIGPFMATLKGIEGMGARALEFAILTAARSGEVRGATWAEIDLKAGTWTIPPERMKAGKEHRVPLSARAVELLEALPRIEGEAIVFTSSKKDKPLSDMSLTAVLRRMDRGDLTAHGFRSTFRDWASETTAYPGDVVEMALAHTIKNAVEAAYRRGDLFEKRARLMADWAKYCGTIKTTGGNVLELRQAAA
jgi:integrase